MAKKILHKGMFQSFLFNIIIFIVLIILGFSYFLSEYLNIQEKKYKLNVLQLENSDLYSTGLSYIKFNSLHNSLGKDFIGRDQSLENILKVFSKEDYEEHFLNTSSGNYESFISIKKDDIKNDKEFIDNSGIRGKIEKILPYYKDNGTLIGDGMTDFKFINYIEQILHKFELSYVGTIGIGNLTLEKPQLKNKIENQLEGEIYNFKLPLTLTGKKKNILNFLYYFENVGIISFLDEQNIEVKQPIDKKKYIDKNGNLVRNDFLDIKTYFKEEDNKDIFNNILVDIEEINFEEYIDSSDNLIFYDKGDTFINFIKNDQKNEKYTISIVLKFYVKGLAKYKTIKYISDVIDNYNKISSIITNAINNGEKNKSKLSRKSVLSLNELKKYNTYLDSIGEKVKGLLEPERLKKEIGNVYKESESYKKIFDNIGKGLDIHLKSVSSEIYKNYNKNKKINE